MTSRRGDIHSWGAKMLEALIYSKVHEVDLQGNELHLTELKLKDSHCFPAGWGEGSKVSTSELYTVYTA